MKKQAVFDTVRALPLFKALSDGDISLLIRRSELLKFEANSEIKSEYAVTVILKGSVSVTKSSDDKKLLMRMFGSGSVTGVATLFSDSHDLVTCLTALNHTEALIIPGEAIAELIHSNGAFAMDYIKFLTSRIRFLNSRIKAYTASGAEAKLALHLLLSDESETGKVELHVSYSRLAEMLDMGRASLYRAIDSLTAKGIILKDGKSILILRKNALQRISDGSSSM
ncbi:MAG: Crp/Fnr family transcriptional regulator [Clostridia bacterium]|nr:Crp/Fnr family transcriptional regulator [Clostridia bacterium]